MEYEATSQAKPFEIILEQHFENASFLWVLHCIALEQPHYWLGDLLTLKGRIDVNLKAILSTPTQAWILCESALTLEEPGEVFTAAIVAFSSGEPQKIEAVVEVALTEKKLLDALVSALTWLPEDLSLHWLEQFLLSKNLDHKHLALESYSALRKNPRDYLSKILLREDCIAHPNLLCSALRLAGELKRLDLAPLLLEKLDSDETDVVAWSAWSLTLMGHATGLNYLQPIAMNSGPFQQQAIELVFRRLPIDQARRHITEMAKTENLRKVITCISILGDPQAIPWLLDLMRQPKWARAAAESYSFITGVNIELSHLNTDAPKNHEFGPNDSPEDDDIEMDEDENLAWPNLTKLQVNWQNINDRFKKGRRYFMGEALSQAFLEKQIAQGSQRCRNIAAVHLALLDPVTPFVNTRIQAQT